MMDWLNDLTRDGFTSKFYCLRPIGALGDGFGDNRSTLIALGKVGEAIGLRIMAAHHAEKIGPKKSTGAFSAPQSIPNSTDYTSIGWDDGG
jgi:hypothetical protein